MAVMTDADRQIAAREFIRKTFEQLSQTATMDTAAIKAALDATDDWVDANAASYNAALPLPFRTTATAAQKNLMVAYCTMKRAGVI
jgi:hypothetical protein